MQLYRGTRVMTADVDTLSMAAYSAARRGRQSSKVGRLWHYNTLFLNVEAPDDSGQSGPPLWKLHIAATCYRRARAGQFDNRPGHGAQWKQPPYRQV